MTLLAPSRMTRGDGKRRSMRWSSAGTRSRSAFVVRFSSAPLSPR